MPPIIDKEKCIECGTCAQICPLDVIRFVKDENGNEVTGETAAVGQTIEYTITLTGQSEPGMQDPILADILPAGLNVVEVTAEAATLTDVTAQYNPPCATRRSRPAPSPPRLRR